MLPEIILGPPGCGKTTTLLGMVEDELRSGTEPDRIAFISFTRQATTEARERAQKQFKLEARQLPYFRTIHSLCFNALGLSSADVLEGERLQQFGAWMGVAVSAKGSVEEGTTFGFELGDRCLQLINTARLLRAPLRAHYDASGEDLLWPLVERVARGLDEYKRAKHLHDFGDMLEMFAAGSWTARLDVLFVDEAQDLSILQWDVVNKLASSARRVVVAGDDDQAIYRFAGAAVEHFVAMPGSVRVLGQSYRVPAGPQGIALDLINRVKGRRAKAWQPRVGGAGSVRRVGNLDAVDFEAGDDTLVLARNSSFLREDASALLRSSGIFYSWHGAPSVRRAVVDAVLDWERLRRGERVTVKSAEAVYAQMTAGVGYSRGHKKLPYWANRDDEVCAQDLRSHAGLLIEDVIWHEALTRLTPEERTYMVRALRRGEKLTREPTVRLSTIHGAKGGQAKHVVLLRDVAFRTYKESLVRPDDDLRVFYVGLTRTMETLTIVAPQTRRSFDL